MTRRRLLAATMLGLAVTILPLTPDAEATLGAGLATAACDDGGCGYWNPMIDCFCPDLVIPHHMPRCDWEAGVLSE